MAYNGISRSASSVGSGAAVTEARPLPADWPDGQLAVRICNTHASQSLYYRFGAAPTTTNYDGVLLAGQFTTEEISPGDLYLLGSGAATTYVAKWMVWQKGSGQ